MACSDRYTEEYIHVFSSAAVRLRPGMYVGSCDSRGLLHMICALVADSFDGTASVVRVSLNSGNSVQIADNRIGPVIPPRSPEDAIEDILISGRGSHAWEMQIANALSEWFRIELRHGGQCYRQEFRRGEPVAPASVIGPAQGTGLTIAFRPDPEIFGDSQFDANTIREFLRTNAMAHSGIRLTLADNRVGTEEVFEYADGVLACVEMLNADRTPLHPDIIVIRGEVEDVRYEVALAWCEEDEYVTQSHVNEWSLPQEGTHVGGCMSGVRRVFRELAAGHISRLRLQKANHERRGLTAAVFVQMAEPMFEGATRERLNNPEVGVIIAAAVRAQLKDYFREHPAVAERIVRAANR